MLIGQTIVAHNTTGTTTYTPWFPRQGDAATSAVEVIAMAADAEVVITIIHKDSDETGDAPNTAATFDTITAIGPYTKRATGLRQLVRYKIVVRHDSGTGIVYAHLRMLAPSWESTGVQGV